MDEPVPFLRSLASSLDALRLRLPATDLTAIEVLRDAIMGRSLARDAEGLTVADATIDRIIAKTSEIEQTDPSTGEDIRDLMDSVWELLDDVRAELGLEGH